VKRGQNVTSEASAIGLFLTSPYKPISIQISSYPQVFLIFFSFFIFLIVFNSF
jgi:hypothetical protein